MPGFTLPVSHDLANQRRWEQCLQVQGVTLPTGYYFGASATTGKRKHLKFTFEAFYTGSQGRTAIICDKKLIKLNKVSHLIPTGIP